MGHYIRPQTRKVTRALIELVQSGVLDAASVLRDALNYMSEADVADFARSEGYVEDADEDEDAEPASAEGGAS